jgi:uncharacterized membrane protein (UPF0127 family)
VERVVYADREGKVLKLVRGLRPWRASACLGAKVALELPVGAINRCGVGVGDHLVIRAHLSRRRCTIKAQKHPADIV